MGIFLAFCCLFCSALNDFVFKVFSGKKGSVGIFVSLVGVIWFCALALLPTDLKTHWQATLVWGIISGLFSLIGNILLIEAMKFQSAGVCSTVYRLNLVGVAVGAALFLGENLDFLKWLGVLSAAGAVCCFFDFDKSASLRKARLGLTLALIASLLRAGLGLSCKYGITRGADPNGISLMMSIFWIAGGFLYCLIRREPVKASFQRQILLTTLISGLFVAGIVFFMNSALKYGNASVVLVIAQMSFLGTLGLSVLFLKEKLTKKKISGMICGIAAILLMSL